MPKRKGGKRAGRQLHRKLAASVPKNASTFERMYRFGVIPGEQFMAGTRFIACYEASLGGAEISAANYEKNGSGGVPIPQQEAALRRQRLGQQYGPAVERLRELEASLGERQVTELILRGILEGRLTFKEIDKRLGRRNGWAKSVFVAALAELAKHWHAPIRKMLEEETKNLEARVRQMDLTSGNR